MIKYVLDKYSGSGHELLEQVVIYANNEEEAKRKAEQIHGKGFLYLFS